MFKKLRAILDQTEFDILLGISGDVSLIFVIDTTGSMGDEIEAAKEIARAIAAHQRDAPVNFILSPFSDPSKHEDECRVYVVSCKVACNGFRHSRFWHGNSPIKNDGDARQKF